MKLQIKFKILLFILFSSYGIDYAICDTSFMYEQDEKKTLVGVVKDSNGEALIGVNIRVKDFPQIGTITDFDGNFSLELPESAKSLLISFIGYENQEIEIKNKTSLNIILNESSEMLDEVQVIAYGTQKKVTVTGALSSVNSDEILKSPVASMGNALSGKMTGLSTIQYSGEPGADDPTILVRGVGTINGNSSPLILVDGVERSFFQIDPNEVENVTVLKDASATAVYGVRGANGVILVTTKRGEKGKAKVSVSTSVGVQMPTRLVDLANSYQYATYYNEAQLNDGLSPESVRFSPEIVQAFKDHSNPIVYPDVDWMDYLLKDASFQSQHNVNISGGTDRVKYFVSAGLLMQNGIFESFDDTYNSNFKYKRFNYRSNLDFEVTKTTSLALNIGGRVEDRNLPETVYGVDQLFRAIHRTTPFNGAGIIDGKWIKSNPDYIPGLDNGYSEDGLDAIYGRGYSTNVKNILETDIALNQKLDFITRGLSIRLKGSYNSSFTHSKVRSKSTPYYIPVKGGEDNLLFRKIGSEADFSYNESETTGRNWYAELALDYKRKFGKHNVSALLLYNQSKKYYPATYPDIPTGYVGLVGRITYDYATRYLVDFNIGYNGSENFAPDKRYGTFPAISLGWIISEEKFMKKQDIIDYLKIRASYGVVGNDKIGGDRFLYLPGKYNFENLGNYFGTTSGTKQPGALEGSLGNGNVTWEKAYKQNYGFDVNFFGGKLKINFDYFKDHRKDILLSRNNVPAFVAMDLPQVNYGVVDNKGYEISVGWSDKFSNNIRYWVNANLSHARSKIIEQDEVKRNEDYLYRTGHPVGQPFAYKFWGFYDETANERYKAEYGTDIAEHSISLRDGDCVYVDVNKDGVINDDDQLPLGYTNNPEYTGGVTLGFSYKNFSFSMLWNYSWNVCRSLGDIYRQPFGSTNSFNMLVSQFENRWTQETASTATLPRPTFTGVKNNYADSDLWLADASYVRLKNIEISYAFKSSFLSKLKVKQLRLYLNGYNLLTFDKLKISDPELKTGGTPTYPLMRVFNVGLKLDF